MTPERVPQLSGRERQIMDVLYRRGRATVADVREDLPDPPSYSAVRALLRILEEKGHAQHEADGPRYVYRPVVERERAKRSALRHVLDTFFDGSAVQGMNALVEMSDLDLSESELARLKRLIDRARTEGIR